MKIVQVKGSNGSGKTTIAKQLLALSKQRQVLRWGKDRGNRVFATVAVDIGWAVIGEYKNHAKMGGCDCLKTVQETKDAIWLTLNARPDLYGIMFEGMMISTITSTFYEYLLGLEKSNGIEPLFVILRTNLDGCLERIANRGTMKPGLNTQNIADKCAIVLKGAATYDQRYVRYIDVDQVDRKYMIHHFLYQVGDFDIYEQLTEHADGH